MALFGKKDAVVETTSEAVTKVAKAPRGMGKNVYAVIVQPRITDEAALHTDKNVYTFEIKKGASKYDVRDAIKALYKVTPVKVHIVNKQPRHSMSRMRGRDMMENGLRKAYVYLKKGDRIELV